ncbi:hypothetical protein [Dysgonomonas sp. BGC7]|nr:hypothetical protein [Dysgonomonas sp. BGC7]
MINLSIVLATLCPLIFYLTYSDFSTNIRPETETFHIVLMW